MKLENTLDFENEMEKMIFAAAVANKIDKSHTWRAGAVMDAWNTVLRYRRARIEIIEKGFQFKKELTENEYR